ncbi:hypothetical protein [Halosegnis marinus]|uniref:Twin-arginine translocation signal domain-containing protein n=1 Tax=Halosegnis marinus TaxID=3034023 RepID=A0ABD5ZNX5_9EURY|nr:hypothetical protein [Halosegnis sp. DT85]
MERTERSRRRFVVAVGAAVAAGLAGCSDAESPGNSTETAVGGTPGDPTATTAEVETDTPTEAETETEEETPTEEASPTEEGTATGEGTATEGERTTEEGA